MLISGPGITNAATAIAQAYSDSVPMLVISTVGHIRDLGMRRGAMHELQNQATITSAFTAFSHTLLDPKNLPEILARAFAIFRSGRPRPVHIEVPIDILDSPVDLRIEATPVPNRPLPDRHSIREAADLLLAAKSPVIIVGGGAKDASKQVKNLAQLLGAPVVSTVAGKGVLPDGHALCLGANLPARPVLDLITQADVVLAIGTELAEPDFLTGDRLLNLEGNLIRIDIEAEQLYKNFLPSLALHGDAKLTIEQLSDILMVELDKSVANRGAELVVQVRRSIENDRGHQVRQRMSLLQVLRDSLPEDGLIAADSTLPVYLGNFCFPVSRPRLWLTSTRGYGTLGYGLPAAIGAKLATPQRDVLCLTGDGGFLFTIEELASAAQLGMPIAIVIWRNEGFGVVRDMMNADDIPCVGVDLAMPDFITVARGFGCEAARPAERDELITAIKQGLNSDRPMVIEVSENATYLV
jgi:acetolactate synthase-1/2/3 large subunit